MTSQLLSTSRIVALSSAAAFGIQIVFALFMLQGFAPEEVGEFSVISQIGFFWMTLALAQTPLSLLANRHLHAPRAAQQAWHASLWRGLGLLPIAALAVWLSQLSLWPALIWALLLAFSQMTWMLAQSFTLRVGCAWHQAAVRVLPPFTALCSTALGMLCFETSARVLLGAALLGYAAGAGWLLPALRHTITASHADETLNSGEVQSDPRSASLRMAHTLVDALLATAIVVVWQRLYGAQETGFLTALLRVLGFVPAVIHMAWAQVALAQAQRHSGITPWRLGLGGGLTVSLLGLLCTLALQEGWLTSHWQGLTPYLLPLILWQTMACLAAAFSHRPFQTATASSYSWLCMSLASLQTLVLLMPWLAGEPLDPVSHLWAFALVSGLGLAGLTSWLFQQRST